MESLQIREIQRSDCTTILKLIKELAEVSGENDVQVKVQDLEGLGFDKEPTLFSGVIAVAEIPEKEGSSNTKKRPIGVGLYHAKYSTWDGPVMHLNTFIVQEKFRKQGVGTKMLVRLAKIAKSKNYSRISFEVPKANEAAQSFFAKHGALNLTKEESWLNYELHSKAVQDIVKEDAVLNEDVAVSVRATQPKDCVIIKDMIQELAGFEKMSDGPKLSVKDLQHDGFFKLHPDYYSFFAELDEGDGEKEGVGYIILFLTFDPFLGKRLHLEDIYVTPKFRGKRIGELLFRNVAKFVDEKHCNGFTWEVLDWNSKAIQFYEKFGATNLTATKGKESLRFKKDTIAKLAEVE